MIRRVTPKEESTKALQILAALGKDNRDNIGWTSRNQLKICVGNVDIGAITPETNTKLAAMVSVIANAAHGRGELSAVSETRQGKKLFVLAAGAGAEAVARILRDEEHIAFTNHTLVPQGSDRAKDKGSKSR
jgi:hypothetical protein